MMTDLGAKTAGTAMQDSVVYVQDVENSMTNKILISIVALGIFMLGITIAKEQHKVDQFFEYGQYSPKYVTYSDEDMLHECEKHDLIYNYEEGICNTSD